MPLSVSSPSPSSKEQHKQRRMSTINSLFVVLKEGSWKPALRKYKKKILSRRNGEKLDGQSKVEAVVIHVHEKADSGVVIDSSLVELTPDEIEAPEVKAPQSIEITTHSALRIVAKRTYALQDGCPIPEFQGEEEVMIKNFATGLNPIDWKSVDYNFCLPEFPWVGPLPPRY